MSTHVLVQQGTDDVRDERPELGLIERSSVVNKSKVEYSSVGVNHTLGCYHGCKYCYAAANNIHYANYDSRDEWRVRVSIVDGVVQQVDDELSRKRNLPERIHLSFVGDPFMWDALSGTTVQDIAETTIELIRVINGHGIPVTVLTKGIYPELPLDELDPRNQYGITAVSLDEDFRKEWEPGAPPVAARIEGLRALAARGARTWASVEPYPTPNLDATAADPLPLLNELAFVDKFIVGKLKYTPEVTAYLNTVDPAFYEGIAGQVQAWCRDNDKLVHFKYGTPLHDPSMVDILSR